MMTTSSEEDLFITYDKNGKAAKGVPICSVTYNIWVENVDYT